MKRFIILLALTALIALVAAPGVSAKPGNPKGPPTHGCDQALENDGDPYDSTCDGSPSLNGNGNGNANGKPCAGCVGAADNKNPPGQFPDGTDNNNGYECDGNNGIGKGNPAHSACEPYSGSAPQTQPKKIKGSSTSAEGVGFGERSSVTTGTVLAIGLIGMTLLAAVRMVVRRRVIRGSGKH